MSGIFINSDAWNFWYGTAEKMSVEGVKADVDFYTVRGGVEAIFYNMNFQRAFFPSKVFTPIWQDCNVDSEGELLLRGEKTDPEYIPLVVNSRLLWEKVPDFMEIRYKRCHENGAEMWHSMRMNDVHWTPLGMEHRPQHSELWRLRKDLIRAWYRHTWRGDWHDNAFDYGKKEVREYHLALLEEYLLNYESDGIELDWMRSVPVFKPGFDEASKDILTSFMRSVRALADKAGKKWKHPMRIAVRVPSRVEDAFSCGMDVARWCADSLADIVIPSPNNLNTENTVQVDLWKAILPSKTVLAPCVDCGMAAAWPFQFEFTQETDNGFASAFYALGADTIYCYNHFPHHHYPETCEFFSYAADKAEVGRRARRCVVTRHDPVGEGNFSYSCFPPEIWSNCCNGSIRVNVGSPTASRMAKIIIGSRKVLDVKILLNTVECRILPSETPLPPLPSPEKEKVFFVQAEIPSGVLHDAWNAIELFNQASESIFEHDLVWAEVFIEESLQQACHDSLK